MAPDPQSKAGEVMSTELYTLTPDTGVVSALRLAVGDKVRHLLVLDQGTLTGIVSMGDLVRARPGQLIGEVMSSPVLCIAPEQTVEEALLIMEQNHVAYLPIVTESFLVGAVTPWLLKGTPPPPRLEPPLRDPN